MAETVDIHHDESLLVPPRPLTPTHRVEINEPDAQREEDNRSKEKVALFYSVALKILNILRNFNNKVRENKIQALLNMSDGEYMALFEEIPISPSDPPVIKGTKEKVLRERRDSFNKDKKLLEDLIKAAESLGFMRPNEFLDTTVNEAIGNLTEVTTNIEKETRPEIVLNTLRATVNDLISS